jgi:hypothetical protein
MARVARKCEKCGAVDARQTWKSEADAADGGALDKWTCPSCAWPEAELVDLEAEPANAG